MLSSFNLKPDVDPAEFTRHYDAFVKEMRALGLLEGSGPVGMRDAASLLDTDTDRPHQMFALMHFTDRAQSERAYDWIKSHQAPSAVTHRAVFALAADMVFTAWEDI